MSISRLGPGTFGATGIVPMAYALFAFALGVAVGLLTRRTVPAMAGTMAGFVGIEVAMPLWIRPHLITPDRATSPLNIANKWYETAIFVVLAAALAWFCAWRIGRRRLA